MKHWEWVLYFYYAVAGLLAVISLIAAFLEEPATASPAADSGFYAAFIVLCVTSIAVLESLRSSDSLRKRFVAAGVGIGVTASAYLWLADEADVHPTSLEFLGSMAIVWLAGAALVFGFFLVVLFLRFDTRKSD